LLAAEGLPWEGMMIQMNRAWKMLLVYTLVLIVGLTLAGLTLNAQLRKTLEANLRAEVLTLARVISKGLPEKRDPGFLDVFCREYKKEANVRITIIRTDGKVLGESDRESTGMENHLQRSEVRSAIEKGTGSTVRRSGTLNVDMFYVAFLVEDKGVVLRLAVPLGNVKKVENKIMFFMSLVLYLTPLLALLVAVLFGRRLVPLPPRP
jgi:two-component system phosphate regulon sensor histidine kinase PhoR